MTDLTDDDKLDRFKLDIVKDADINTDQRDKADEDLRFINTDGGTWENFSFQPGSSQDKFKSRIKLEFDIVSAYVRRFIGQWNQNRVGVEFKPDDMATSDDDAELINGIYRADFRQNSGKMSVDNAVDEVAAAGYGCFKLATIFEDEGDPENENQRIEWRPLHNAYNTVYWDNSAKRIDKRDARRVTELMAFTDDSFDDAFPDATPSSAYSPESRSFNNIDRTQVNIIFIAVRYEIVKKKETIFVYDNIETGKQDIYTEEQHEDIKDELKKDESVSFRRKRDIVKQHVEKTVFSGEEILKPTKTIAGKWLPIIAIYGFHAYIDGVEWYHGLVRKLKDAGRLFNMQLSKLAEDSASSGQNVPIFAPNQMKGIFSKIWADRNTAAYQLCENNYDRDGNFLNSGPVGWTQPAQLDQNTATLLEIVPNYIKDVTGAIPQETMNPDVSGKAIIAMQKRENLNTQSISDNIANAIEWSGTVYESMASEIYTTQRIVNTVGLDGTSGQKQLLKSVLDEQTGRVIESNILSGKKFRSYSDVGPQYDTLAEQNVEDIKQMIPLTKEIPGAEDYIPALYATLINGMTGPLMGPLKKLNRRKMLLQGLVEPETPEEEAFLQQAQQQQQQPDPQQQLIDAATQQQLSEARNLDAASIEKGASAQLKAAQTEKTIADTQKVLSDISVNEDNAETNQIKTLIDIRNESIKRQQEAFQSIQQLPIQNRTIQ